MKLFKKPIPRVKYRLGPHTRKIMSEKKITARKKKTDPYKRFSRSCEGGILWMETNFDLLQYTIVITPRVIQMHDLDSREQLDLLLYLFPIQYFTRKDYYALHIKQAKYCNFKSMLEKGLLEVHIDNKVNSIFTLSKRAQEIVKDYYLYLSGRKKITVKKGFNTAREKKEDALLEQLKKQAKANPERHKNFIIR